MIKGAGDDVEAGNMFCHAFSGKWFIVEDDEMGEGCHRCSLKGRPFECGSAPSCHDYVFKEIEGNDVR